MNERCVDCLARQRRLAVVSHDSGEESQIRRWQWPTIDRNDAGRRIGEPEGCETCHRIGVAAVGVVDGNNSILRSGRNWKEDSDQSLLEQQAVCRARCGDARNIVARTCCSIDQTKDRISALATLKPVLHALSVRFETS